MLRCTFFPCVLASMVLVLSAARAVRGEVKLPNVFSEKMVLQRDVPIPVWGRAADGEKVTVLFEQGNQKVETVAAGGKWQVTLAPLTAGGPFVLTVMGEKNRIQFRDVLVGEVWVTAGQSNMMFEVVDTPSGRQAVADARKYPHIRVAGIIGGTIVSDTPQTDILSWWGPMKWDDAAWRIRRSSKKGDIPGGYSAVSYYFARELYRHLQGKVPVGMITFLALRRAESWVDDETVAADPGVKHLRGRKYPHDTSKCYNGTIAALAPYPVRGAIYYQGEMNGGAGMEFRKVMPALIRSWRKAWKRPDMPFLFVQLPGFAGTHKGEKDKAMDMDAASLEALARSGDQTWTTLREAQLLTWQSVPNTGMAVTIDLGEPYDIHPPRKLPVAQRLFLHARKLAYGEKGLVVSGPVPGKVEVTGGSVVVHFEHVGGGLVAKGGKLKGFEIAAPDEKYVPAAARIEGRTVVVSSPDVKSPKSIRYAWAGFPLCTLYNKEGLPATPFRWPVPKGPDPSESAPGKIAK